MISEPTAIGSATPSEQTPTPITRSAREETIEAIKANRWIEARSHFEPFVSELRIAVGDREADKLDGVVVRDIKYLCRISEYADLLRRHELDWLDKFLHRAFSKVVDREIEANLNTLHLAISFVAFSFRRDARSFEKCFEQIEQVAKLTAEIGAKGEDAASASYLSRMYFYRFKVATRRQERDQAEKFLDLSASYLTLQAQFEPERAANLLYLKAVPIALQQVFLQISAGRFAHATELLGLVKRQLGETGNDQGDQQDPQAALECRIAESVCQRCLGADDQNELSQAFERIALAVTRFQKTFPHSRLLMRCWYEQSLTLLLMLGLPVNRSIKSDLMHDLNQRIRFMNESLAIASGRGTDPSLKAQIGILQARILIHGKRLRDAERETRGVIEMISGTPLKLLHIEALICLAVALFRQKKFPEATLRLHKALQLNQEFDLMAELSEHSQPALAAASFLYLVRVYVRTGDLPNAEKYFRKYEQKSAKVEHRWVIARLAPSVEKELTKMRRDWQTGSDVQLRQQHWRRKQIERAILEEGTHKVANIAARLGVTPQTLYGWQRDLKEKNLDLGPEAREAVRGVKEHNRQEALVRLKEEIENARRLQGTSNITVLAGFLKVSRQTLYNRLKKLEKAGMYPDLA